MAKNVYQLDVLGMCTFLWLIFTVVFTSVLFPNFFMSHANKGYVLTIYSLITYKYPFQLIFTLFLVLYEIRYIDSISKSSRIVLNIYRYTIMPC